MANQTPLTANFQAHDWEFLFGLAGAIPDVDVLDCKDKLRQYYADQVSKPQGSTVINVNTFENVVVTLYQRMLQSAAGVCVTSNGQPYNRIRTAVLAMNNVADNYILDAVTALEDQYNTSQGDLRKAGRKAIMMRTYDAN